jgi:hypothetical protein
MPRDVLFHQRRRRKKKKKKERLSNQSLSRTFTIASHFSPFS